MSVSDEVAQENGLDLIVAWTRATVMLARAGYNEYQMQMMLEGAHEYEESEDIKEEAQSGALIESIFL